MTKNNVQTATFGTRRQFGRRQTNWHGWLKVRGRPVIPCLVKDFSPGGALLEFEIPEGFPDQFQLTIESESFQSWCKVRHREIGRLGVQFVEAEVRTPQKVETTDRFSYASLLAEAQKDHSDSEEPLALLRSDPFIG
jgi:hypothetical protein